MTTDLLAELTDLRAEVDALRFEVEQLSERLSRHQDNHLAADVNEVNVYLCGVRSWAGGRCEKNVGHDGDHKWRQ